MSADRWYPERVECHACNGHGFTVLPMARVGLPGEYARRICEQCDGNGTAYWIHNGKRIWPSFWTRASPLAEFNSLGDVMDALDDLPPDDPADREPDEDALIRERYGVEP